MASKTRRPARNLRSTNDKEKENEGEVPRAQKEGVEMMPTRMSLRKRRSAALRLYSSDSDSARSFAESDGSPAPKKKRTSLHDTGVGVGEEHTLPPPPTLDRPIIHARRKYISTDRDELLPSSHHGKFSPVRQAPAHTHTCAPSTSTLPQAALMRTPGGVCCRQQPPPLPCNRGPGGSGGDDQFNLGRGTIGAEQRNLGDVSTMAQQRPRMHERRRVRKVSPLQSDSSESSNEEEFSRRRNRRSRSRAQKWPCAGSHGYTRTETTASRLTLPSMDERNYLVWKENIHALFRLHRINSPRERLMLILPALPQTMLHTLKDSEEDGGYDDLWRRLDKRYLPSMIDRK